MHAVIWLLLFKTSPLLGIAELCHLLSLCPWDKQVKTGFSFYSVEELLPDPKKSYKLSTLVSVQEYFVLVQFLLL